MANKVYLVKQSDIQKLVAAVNVVLSGQAIDLDGTLPAKPAARKTTKAVKTKRKYTRKAVQEAPSLESGPDRITI